MLLKCPSPICFSEGIPILQRDTPTVNPQGMRDRGDRQCDRGRTGTEYGLGSNDDALDDEGISLKKRSLISHKGNNELSAIDKQSTMR